MKLKFSIAAVIAIAGAVFASDGSAHVARAESLHSPLQSNLSGSTVEYWGDYDGNGVVGSSGDTLLATTTTDVNGYYEFTNIVAQRPQVLGLLLRLPPAQAPIVPNPGGMWELGGPKQTPLPSGKLYLDADDNGQIDPSADMLLGTTTVGANGAYQFQNSMVVPVGATIGIVFSAPTCPACVVPNPGGFWET